CEPNPSCAFSLPSRTRAYPAPRSLEAQTDPCISTYAVAPPVGCPSRPAPPGSCQGVASEPDDVEPPGVGHAADQHEAADLVEALQPRVAVQRHGGGRTADGRRERGVDQGGADPVALQRGLYCHGTDVGVRGESDVELPDREVH